MCSLQQSMLLLYFACLLNGLWLTAAWTSSPFDPSRTLSSTTTVTTTKTRDFPRIQPWITYKNGNPNQHFESMKDQSHNTVRRSLLQSMVAATLVAVLPSSTVHAAADNKDLTLYQRNKENLTYQIQLPTNFKETQKPLKTHLDEVNFVNDDIKGYQYGITVDPVRINSLKEVSTTKQQPNQRTVSTAQLLAERVTQ